MFSSRGGVGLVVILWLAVVLLTVSPSQGGGVITENFNNNQYDQELFELINFGVGSATVADQQLQVTIPANDGSSFAVAGLGDKFDLVGDFDIQVDFSLPTWSSGNGVNAGIVLPNCEVVRNGIPAGRNGDQATDVYLFFCSGYNVTLVNTGDQSGKLRLTRTGNTITGSYWLNNSWQAIGSHTDAKLAAPVSGYVGAFSGGYGPSQTAQATFDNYQITYTKLSFGNGNPTAAILGLLLMD